MFRPTTLGLSIGLAAALLPLSAQAVAATGNVTLTGALTSFQSALSPYYASGNGSLDGVALPIDASLPSVRYDGGDATLFPQSRVVQLAPGTTQVQFEYSDALGNVDLANPNRIGFTAAGPAQVGVGDVFKIGTVTYTNGFWYPYAAIGLTITTHSDVAALDQHSFVGQIIVKVSSPVPFVPDPEANADFFYLADASGPLAPLGSVRVYEQSFQPASQPGNSGSVDLYARIGSLVPVRFDSPDGGAFLSPSLDPVTSVPEPAVYALFLAGLAGIGAWKARRRDA